ncbi:putative formin-like protein 3-like [Capsicum annuum]|nr:putative formin-like protein 3-like [Capsicum annuum]KAF3630489.1 putative formin-like protein 3-like [Capsicum annuum]
MQRGPIQRTSPETQSSGNLDESVRLSIEPETGADNIDRAVASRARDIVNYCGWIIITTVLFRHGSWQNIVLKHREAMWYRVKDKFEVRNGLPKHKLQGFVIYSMQRLFRSWKARLHVIYSSYNNDKDRLSHRPKDIELDDWKHLVEHFGNDKFKGQLQQLVVEQQSEEIDLWMIKDEILTLVLGEISGYVRGKGYGAFLTNGLTKEEHERIECMFDF